MKNKSSYDGIRNGAMMTALCVVFMLISIYVPVLSVFGMFLSGIPIAALYSKNGLKYALLGILCSVLIMFAFTANIFSVLSLAVAYTVPGLVVGICLKKGFTFFNTLLFASAAFLFGIFAQIFMINVFFGGIEKMFIEIFELMKNTFLATLDTVSDEELKNELLNNFNTALDITKTSIRFYFPSILIIISFAFSYFSYLITGFILKRLRLLTYDIVPFYMLKAPKSMCYFAILILLIKNFSNQNGMVSAAFSNIILIIYVLVAVCGFSFIDYKFKTLIKNLFLRFLIYVVVFIFGGPISSILFYVFVIIGMFDSSMNFRKIYSFDDENVSGR